MREKIVRNSTRAIYRNCETNSDRAAARREDRAVDADHLACGIDEGSTRVAGVDRCVRLDHVDVNPGAFAGRGKVAPGTAHHPRGHARLGISEEKTIRISD